MKPVKVGFALLSNSQAPLPSTRICVLNMLPFLREAHFDPHIVFEPDQETATETPDMPDLAERLVQEGFRVVFFQKVHGPSTEALARKLSQAGIKTVFAVCDHVLPAMVEATDATVTVTDYLKTLYPRAQHAKIHVVHDGIENPDARKAAWSDHRGSRAQPLRATLVTSASLSQLPVIGDPPDWLKVSIVGRYAPAGKVLRRLREARWKVAEQRPDERLNYVSFLLNRRIERLAWDPVGVYEHMCAADIGIIPVELPIDPKTGRTPPGELVKSENRLTMKMSTGLPVIATPIPSYEAIIEQGVNGFLARSRADWVSCLEALRDPALRREMGARARAAVLERYSKKEQARRLLAVLHELLPDAEAALRWPVQADAP